MIVILLIDRILQQSDMINLSALGAKFSHPNYFLVSRMNGPSWVSQFWSPKILHELRLQPSVSAAQSDCVTMGTQPMPLGRREVESKWRPEISLTAHGVWSKALTSPLEDLIVEKEKHCKYV